MNGETAVLWLLTLAPLSLSPGPANILYAASGSSFGVKRTLPFLLGTNLICLLQTLMVGLGLGALMINHPAIATATRYAGVALLLYLAFRLFRSTVNTHQEVKPLGFLEGIMVELLNAKFLMIPAIMFSQFYIPEQHGIAGMLVLTLSLTMLTLSSNLL